MSEKKPPLKILLGEWTTPVAPAVWPKLVVPETKFNPEGVYTTDLRLTVAQAEAAAKTLQKYQEEALAKFRELYPKAARKIAPAALPIKEEVDKEGDPTGSMLLRAKRTATGTKKDGTPWKANIKFADSRGQPVKKEGLSLWGGSEIRLFTQVFGYLAQSDKRVGITLEIRAVQIKTLVKGGQDDVAIDALDDEDGEGYVADDMADLSDDAGDGNTDF